LDSPPGRSISRVTPLNPEPTLESPHQRVRLDRSTGRVLSCTRQESRDGRTNVTRTRSPSTRKPHRVTSATSWTTGCCPSADHPDEGEIEWDTDPWPSYLSAKSRRPRPRPRHIPRRLRHLWYTHFCTSGSKVPTPRKGSEPSSLATSEFRRTLTSSPPSCVG